MRIAMLAAGALVGAMLCCGCTALSAEESRVPLTAVVATRGTVSIWERRREVAAIAVGVGTPGGRADQESSTPSAGQAGPVTSTALEVGESIQVALVTKVGEADDGVSLSYELTPAEQLGDGEISLRLRLPGLYWHDATWSCGGETGVIPELYARPTLFRLEAASVMLETRDRRIALTFPQPAIVTLSDGRKWGADFTIWVTSRGPRDRAWAAGETRALSLTVTMDSPIEVQHDREVTIRESGDWIPVQVMLEIERGSALDFSQLGLTDAPAGRHGWVRAVGGHFEFSDRPGERVRFYGANVVWSALYLDREQCDRFADLLRRMGYNSVRIHHYERELVDSEAPDSLTFRQDSLDRLDYLFAALKKRGIYLSIDLFVSRAVKSSEIFPGTDGRAPNFKVLVPVDDRAFDNLKEFARRLLTHVNPYTGLAWKDDPALAFISFINEGMSLNYWDRLDERARELWEQAFNRWLLERYGSREALAGAWGEALKPEEDPARGTVALPTNFENSPAGLDLVRCCAELHRRMYDRMAAYLCEELGCRALLTDMNAWTFTLQNQWPRAQFDYADSHFYWDHPEFMRRGWRLPSKGWSGGGSAVAEGGGGPAARALTRFYNTPFTLSEYNWAYPNPYRSESGLVTGAYCALQDYGGLWRYAFAGYREALEEPPALSYFYYGSDPINTAAERAAVCLFLRGDVAPAQARVALTSSLQGLLEARHVSNLDARISRLGWVTQIGMSVDGAGQVAPQPQMCLPLSGDGCPLGDDQRLLAHQPLAPDALSAAVEGLRERRLLPDGNATDVSKEIYESQTREILLDSEQATLVVNTPRTAGGCAVAPGRLSAGPLEVELEASGGAVWVSSVDGEPIASSKRMLLVHITDVQNSGARFGDQRRHVLEESGGLPYLARRGKARVSLTNGGAEALQVWALDMSGRRLAQVPVVSEGRSVSFVVDTRGPAGACFYYEITTL
ncbi:MAG: hypothetical protein ACE149_11785 [Armatimonadota bacterium]